VLVMKLNIGRRYRPFLCFIYYPTSTL